MSKLTNFMQGFYACAIFYNNNNSFVFISKLTMTDMENWNLLFMYLSNSAKKFNGFRL